HKALTTDIHQQVVPHRAMGQEQLSQKGGARGDHAVALLPAGSAGIDGFPNAEQTVSQSFSPALNRLLYVHAAATDGAGLGRFAFRSFRPLPGSWLGLGAEVDVDVLE